MGFLDKIFGDKKDYPSLDPASPAAGQLAQVEGQLAELHDRAKKPLEVLPAEEGAYVFIGHPPKNFGVAWIEGDRILTFKTLAEEHHMDPKQLQPLADKLREIYEANLDDPRYTTNVAGHEIVVTPSEEFRAQVRAVIREAMH